jgi:hypothetical protein
MIQSLPRWLINSRTVIIRFSKVILTRRESSGERFNRHTDESDGGHLYTRDSTGTFDNAPMSAQLDTTPMNFTPTQDFGYDLELLQQDQQPSLGWNPTALPHHASSNLQRNPSSMVSSYSNDNFDVTRGSIRSSRSSKSSLFDPSLRSKHSSATTIGSFASSMASVDRQSGSVYRSNRNTTPARSTIRSGLSNITNVTSDNKLKSDTPYECTYHPCHTRFKQKGEWKRHEASLCAPQKQHTCKLDLQSTLNSQPCPTHPYTLMTIVHLRDAHNSFVCPQSTHTPTTDGGPRFSLGSKPRNRFESTRLDKLKKHLSERHQLRLKEVPSDWISDTQGKQTDWGCGFCGAYLRTWNERVNHIGDHFADDGKTMEEWNKVLAGQGLLSGRGRAGMAGGRGGWNEAPEEDDFMRQTARLSRELEGVGIEDEHTQEDKDLFD